LDVYFERYLTNLRIKQSRIKINTNGQRLSVQFDVEKYFQYFNYLQVEKGWTLSYFDSYSEEAGKPHIFVKKKGNSVDVYKDDQYLDINNSLEHIHLIIMERNYSVTKRFPHKIILDKELTLLEYSCGVMF
jgi:hypothetical protein